MTSSNPYAAPGAALNASAQVAGPMSTKEVLTSFEGRIGRQQFWLQGMLPVIGLQILAMIAAAVVGAASESLGGIVGFVFFLPSMWFSLAVQIKRWHDRDKSGWWILIGIIPILGGLWAFIETGFLQGTDGPNSYGADPLQSI